MRSSSAKLVIAFGLTSALLSLGACGDSGDATAPAASPAASGASSTAPSATPSAKPSKVPASTTLDAVKVAGAYGKEPKVTVKAPWAVDKTRTKVLQKGDGDTIAAGQSVRVDYYGVNGRTGKKFDDSFSRGQPVAFDLEQVVPGFKKGLVGQQQGSRVLIAMPGTDGYDAGGGNPQAGIEVGDTLIFVVDVVGVELSGPEGTKVTPKAGLPTVTDTAKAPKITVPKTKAPTSLQVQPLIKGKGVKVAATDTITFDYTWVRWSDGKLLEETYTAKPASLALNRLLPGMAKGLVNQTVGSRVLLVIPPADGYPQGNETPKIEKTDTLVMVVDILFAQPTQ